MLGRRGFLGSLLGLLGLGVFKPSEKKEEGFKRFRPISTCNASNREMVKISECYGVSPDWVLSLTISQFHKLLFHKNGVPLS